MMKKRYIIWAIFLIIGLVGSSTAILYKNYNYETYGVTGIKGFLPQSGTGTGGGETPDDGDGKENPGLAGRMDGQEVWRLGHGGSANFTGNLSVTSSATGGYGFFTYLGSSALRIVSGFFTDVDATTFTGNGSTITTVDAITLDGYDSSYFMPLNTSFDGTQFDFADGWTNGGSSIKGGEIFTQTLYAYNITGLSVTTLQVNGSIVPGIQFNNTFDIGTEAEGSWNEGRFGGEVYIMGAPSSKWLYNQSTPYDTYNYNMSAWNDDGTNVWRDAGAVGIGTSSPLAPLQVEDTTSGVRNLSILQYENAIDSAGRLMFASGDVIRGGIESYIDAGGEVSLRFYETTGSALVETMRLDAGAVGIGTPSPQQELHINGTGNIAAIIEAGSTTQDSWIQLKGGAPDDWYLYNDNGAGNFIFYNTNVTNIMTIHQGGNVGIGTASPNELLEVANTGAAAIRIADTTASEYTVLQQAATDGDFQISRLGTGGIDIGIQPDGDVILAGTGSSGNVGIGTTTPNHDLFVNRSGEDASMMIQSSTDNALLYLDGYTDEAIGIAWQFNNSGNNAWLLNTPGDLDLRFYSYGVGAEVMRFDYETGNVGIGTSSPGHKLHILDTVNNAQIRLETDKVDGIATMTMENDAQIWSVQVRDDDQFYIRDSTATANRLTIDTSGNVGIGTDAPGVQLEVNKNTNGAVAIEVDNQNAGASAWSDLRLTTDGGTTFFRRAGTGLGAPWTDNTVIQDTGGGDIIIYGAAEIARFANGGNVGIGTASPSHTLTVVGDINATGDFLLGDDIAIGRDGRAPTAEIDVQADGTTGENVIRMRNSNTADKLFIGLAGGGGSNLTMLDAGNNHDIMLNSDGDSWIMNNVGIGTTAPTMLLHVEKNNAWLMNVTNSTDPTLTVNNAGDVIVGGTGTEGQTLAVYNHAENSATSVQAYPAELLLANTDITANTYSLLKMGAYGAADGVYFQSIGPSNNVAHLAIGTYNSAGGVTEILRVDRTGKLGINTATPTHALNVVGDVNTTGTYYVGGGPGTMTSNGTDIIID